MWEPSGFVLETPAHKYVVNCALTCGAALVNESFGYANTNLHYNAAIRILELQLVARVEAALNKALVNYTSPHQNSFY